MNAWSFFIEHRAEIASATLEHIVLVGISLAIAILIGVPTGMLIVRHPRLRGIALGFANIVQTIPSLAYSAF